MIHPLSKVQNPTLINHLYQLLDEAIEVDGAAFGYIHLYNRISDSLEIVVHRGFDTTFLAIFQQVRAFDASVCARAYRLGSSVAIGDVSSDPFISQFLSVFMDRGIYAMQSTPILDPDKVVIGMLSTHFPRHCRPTSAGMASIKQIASKVAAGFLEHGLLQQYDSINANQR
ncbi:MAG TPA: GAF domain-containing protein [Methylophilaceae bacterium]|nr:GAF domain-containing protein [Methylophilaceae bacterium]